MRFTSGQSVMPGSAISGTALIAQCKSFADKMPAFYAAVIACMVAQIIVFQGRVPFLLGVVAPAAIVVVAAVRMVWWLERKKHPFTEEEARESLRKSKVILFLSTGVIVGMDTILFHYVDDASRTFLLVQLFGCTMTGIYCLMYIRSAAYLMAVVLVASLAFVLDSYAVDIGAGIAVAVVALLGTMIYAMRSYHRDFLSLIETKIEAQALSAENRRLANLDMLTGLFNRRQFFADLDSLCAATAGTDRRIAVAVADLDGFKPINDTHGHLTGDKVLQAIAIRIRDQSAGFSRVYRLGGDEFALIAEAVECERVLTEQAQDLISTIGQPVQVANLIVSTGCSIGIAVYPTTAQTPEHLYERADYALYNAKRAGRNQAFVFTTEHELELRRQGALEQALRGADLATEFYLVYQPIVRAIDGETIAFECLARWRSPTLGEVSPATFIPVAEQSGLIAVLTPVLLRRALAEAGAWPKHIRMSFNLSAHDIASPERTLAIIAIIAQGPISPDRVDLELTETALLHNFSIVRDNMLRLKSVGVNISLDDFGTGYSSLSHVHALPLDKIKIDRSFVKNLEDNVAGQTIVRSMMTLCRDLRLSCVVEGVETDSQLRAVSELGCEQIQGYYFSKPLAAAEVARYLSCEIGARAV